MPLQAKATKNFNAACGSVSRLSRMQLVLMACAFHCRMLLNEYYSNMSNKHRCQASLPLNGFALFNLVQHFNKKRN